MKAIIMGGTSGIGKSIVNRLEKVCDKVIGVGRKEIDTTSLDSVRSFAKKNKGVDILVLNTGGPPDLQIDDITDQIWTENFNKLFLSFLTLTKEIGLKDNGYVFLISSYIIKQPGKELIISSSIRAGFVNLFKSLSKIYEKKKICFINIAPGPIRTKRLENLLKKENITVEEHAKTMPGKHIPHPDEIGLFVEFVIKNKIKSFNGITIPFDSGLLESI
tara:strand:+ start:5082 stop:5735 length:654 start_codon:yes stop_codon:yes gene_type:complete